MNQVNDIIDCIAEFIEGNDSIVSKSKKFKNADFNAAREEQVKAAAALRISVDPRFQPVINMFLTVE